MEWRGCGARKQKARTYEVRAFWEGQSLTMTYFHTGCSTIIGAALFHGPVRDGKGWDQRAIVIRHNGMLFAASGLARQTTQSGKK